MEINVSNPVFNSKRKSTKENGTAIERITNFNRMIHLNSINKRSLSTTALVV